MGKCSSSSSESEASGEQSNSRESVMSDVSSEDEESLQDLEDLVANKSGDNTNIMNPDASMEHLCDGLVHLFLPKKTPEFIILHELKTIERYILSHVNQSIADLIEKSDFAMIEDISRMLSNWELVQPTLIQPQDDERFQDNFSRLMSSLDSNSTVPLYVRNQNCTILFRKHEDGENVCVDTFRSALPSEMVMGNVGSLSMDFPEFSEVVQNIELLSSQTFAKNLLMLTQDEFDLSMALRFKGEQAYGDDRDVAEPFLINDWLVGILSPVVPSPTKTTISKKIRDQITFAAVEKSANYMPFRRSGMWMSIKATLQLKLLQIFEDDLAIAKRIYKLLLLQVLSDACQKYYHIREKTQIDLDLVSQMLAKLGRRAHKLQTMEPEPFQTFKIKEDVEVLQNHVLNNVHSIASKLHQFMKKCQSISDEDYSNVSTPGIPFELPPRTRLEYLADLNHWIPFLNSYHEPRIPAANNFDKLASGSSPQLTGDMKSSIELQRYFTLDSLLTGELSLSPNYSSNVRVWTHDAEQFMKKKAISATLVEGDSGKILDLVQRYITHATKIYEGNPVSISQMILSVLKVVEGLDRAALKSYAVLRDYLSGINCETFDYLLLPHKDDMELLNETLKYFSSRNRIARVKEEIITAEITSNSFAVRFATEDDEMKEMLQEIHKEVDRRYLQRLVDVGNARDECKAILMQLDCAGPCRCDYDHRNFKGKKDKYGQQHQQQHHHHSKYNSKPNTTLPLCKRCELDQEYYNMRTSCLVFERPLPSREHLQNAVVFEILIPDKISHLRDCLALLKFGLLDEPLFSEEENAITTEWLDFKNLTEYLDTKRLFPQSVIKLGSRCLPYSKVAKIHLRKCRPDVMTCTDEEIMVENGLQCIYNYSFEGIKDNNNNHSGSKLHRRKPDPKPRALFYALKNLRSQCAFQISNMGNSGPYMTLQDYLESFTHSQNSVIANQTACHANLCLDEFLEFGAIRAGYRIQLRNLYRAISSRVLSLEEEPCLALIMMLSWQNGPQDKEGNGEREAHCDFKDHIFANELLELLDKVIRTNKENFSHPLIVFGAVVIVARIMELNEHLFEKCYYFMNRWRTLLKDWLEKIEIEVKGEYEESYLNDLKRTGLIIKICCAFTYNFAGSIKWDKVMRTADDVVLWLHTITSLYEIDEGALSTLRLSEFMRALLFLGRRVPFRLQLEEEIGYKNPLILQALHNFMCEKWSKARLCSPRGTQSVFPNQKNLVRSLYMENGETLEGHWICFDFILGLFLVNGFPQDYLSEEITSSIPFKRYFKLNTRIRTQRESSYLARTVEKWHGKHYEFRTLDKEPNSSDGNVLIKEISEDGTVLTLLDHLRVREYFSNMFIDNFTHWLDPRRKIVYFRRISTKDSDYELGNEYKLVKEEGLDMWRFYDEKNHAYIFSVKSIGFGQISEAFSRFEFWPYVNILMDKGSEQISAHLPRYGLRFNVKNGKLECVEYPGFYLVGRGEEETLLGLKQGIQLKSKRKRVLVVPHGRIIVEDPTENRDDDEEIDEEDSENPVLYQQLTKIDLGELKQPPYFVYEFDEILKRLVANNSKSAWLYLAALHAVTSSFLPDPFTQITGTEMAVRILQSGFVWSSSPYDEDSKRILNFIKELSPKRYYYGHKFLKGKKKQESEAGINTGTMEIIQWPSGLPSMAAYDGFEIIVEKLIEDSERLGALHYSNLKKDKEEEISEKEKAIIASSPKLRLRGYLQTLNSYNGAAAISRRYFKTGFINEMTEMPENTIRFTSSKSDKLHMGAVISIAGIRMSAQEDMKSKSFRKNNLDSFLFPSVDEQVDPGECHPENLNDLFNTDFRRCWASLYERAMEEKKTSEEKHELTLKLCGMAYVKAPLTQIVNLHYISEYADQVDWPMVPTFPDRVVEFDDSELQTKLEYILLRYVDYSSACGEAEVPQSVKRYCKGLVKDIANYLVINYWPCQEIKKNGAIEEKFCNSYLGGKYDVAMDEINELLMQRYWTKQAKEFTHDVEEKLEDIFNLTTKIDKHASCKVEERAGVATTCNWEKQWKSEDIALDDWVQNMKANQWLIRDASRYYNTGRILGLSQEPVTGSGGDSGDLQKEGKIYMKRVTEIMQNLEDMVGENCMGNLLHVTGLCPRMDPTTLLKRLVEKRENHSVIQEYSGGLAVLWSHIKRINRCLAYQASEQESELQGEFDNKGYENWSPRNYPEWLLLELELDLMIRPIQVDVAKQMMKMPDRRNGVLQLNMGEGKTSVIVPMLSSVLARENRLCRVTVLGSMFNMNLKILSFAVGGLLNRRVYAFPCRRDMKIDDDCVEMIQRCYQEALEMKGVVLTLPEYRLSFRLLAFDNILKKKDGLGLKLLRTENWLRQHARDVLDESDELLSVKYQLVYTIGDQVQLDGGALRWVTCQKLLRVVQDVGKMFLEKYGESLVEFDMEQGMKFPHQFASIRLLDSVVYPFFISAVGDIVLNQAMPMATPAERAKFKHIFTSERIEKATLEEMMKGFAGMPDHLKRILLISGYLRRGVLTLGLSKRWRVEYGVDPTKRFRRMAVPFRAKDVPAERTEFGHPDLAILLTHLSYYYSGLTDKQVDETLKILKTKQGSENTFDQWMKQIPAGLVPGYLKTLHGLNLKDTLQRKKLFDLLRKHKLVIDFWLSVKVFPRESKQFSGKLVMTSWDLCCDRQEHPVTGFSGTNDSSVLLPLPITQQDLPALKDTNEDMEKMLVQRKNQGHNRGFPMGVTCRDILEQMKKDKLTVLIDAGALMLECDNEQVAELWLDVDKSVEGVLYFNKANELMVKCRRMRGQKGSTDIALELSSFLGRLDKCGVFLDDQHTRGTDLKFPDGTRGCVTVGGKMKRDKLIQACLRMRKLESGRHSVTFYLSHEAVDKIRKDEGKKGSSVKTKEILEWVKMNTTQFNEDGLLYWALAGKNYAQRLAAEDNFYFPRSWKDFQLEEGEDTSDASLLGKSMILAEQSVDDEVTTLKEMYGQHAEVNFLVNIIPIWFNLMWDRVTKKNGNVRLDQSIRDQFLGVKRQILAWVKEHAPQKTHFSGSNMDEEQEKELELEKEMELEVEKVVERMRAQPEVHMLNENVKKVVVDGEQLGITEGIMRLCDAFMDTTFGYDMEPEGWGREVFATTDFISVISDRYFRTDHFIRPVEYFALTKGRCGRLLALVLSPFEVNELMPWYRSGNVACPLHMFSARRSEKQDSLLNNHSLVLPHCETAITIPVGGKLNAVLNLASGNLYFGTMNEQKAFARFLCLAPQPWNPTERKVYEKGGITRSMYVTPMFRTLVFGDTEKEGFDKDPTGLVKHILVGRHPVLGDMAHVVQLLNEKKFVSLE